MARVRADQLVLARGLVETRTKAQALILAGEVVAGDHRVDKPGQLLDEAVELRLKSDPSAVRYVSVQVFTDAMVRQPAFRFFPCLRGSILWQSEHLPKYNRPNRCLRNVLPARAVGKAAEHLHGRPFPRRRVLDRQWHP